MDKNKFYDSCELQHGDFKPKYIDKKPVNGKMRYYYDTPTKDVNSKNSNINNTNNTKDKDHSKVVKEIMAGKWGNGKERWDKLSKAGYDWATVQNEVNKKLGNSFRHAIKHKEVISKTIDRSKNKTIKSMEKESKKGETILNELFK